MALLVLLCMLMTVSSTFGEDCGCSSQPPTYPPGSNPPYPPSTPPPSGLPCNYSQIDLSRVVDKESVRKEYVNLYYVTIFNTYLDAYGDCSFKRPSFGCWTYYIVKIIIDFFRNFVLKIFTKQVPTRGVPQLGESLPFWYPYTEIRLRSCGGNKFCGSGACLSEGGRYYNPGICYAFQDPLSQYGLSPDCNTTMCAYILDDDKFYMTDERGVQYVGPSAEWAERDPQAAVDFVRSIIQQDSYATTVEALKSSIANYPAYTNYSNTCEINYPDEKSYFSNCGILQGDPEKYP